MRKAKRDNFMSVVNISMMACILAVALLSSGVVRAAVPVFEDSILNFTLAEDQQFVYYLNATDADGNYPLNFSSTAGDPGVNFTSFHMENHNATSALINFTPTNADVAKSNATYDFIINIRDTASELAAKIIYFYLNNTNDAPNITAVTPYNASDPYNFSTTVMEGSTLDLNVTVIDLDTLTYEGDNLTFYWYINGVENQSKLNFTNETALYSPTFQDSNFNSSRLHNISIFVYDRDGAFDNYTWRINVTDRNREPWLNQSIQSYFNWSEDVNLTDIFNLQDHFHDNDTDNYPLNYTVNYLVGNISQVSVVVGQESLQNRSVSFIPAPDFYGVLVITFNASDQLNVSESNNITLNVTPVNDAPYVVAIANQTATIGVPFSYQVVANDDVDNNTVLNYYNNHTELFNISTNGLINFTPQPGQEGNYTIVVNVDDTMANTTVNFTLDIINNNIPYMSPYPIPDQTATELVLFTLNLSGFDDDLDNVTFSSNLTQLNVNHTGNNATFYFTPGQSDVGNHTVAITVTDSLGAINSSTFNLEVLNTDNSPILLSIPNLTMRVNRSFMYWVNATDQDTNIEAFYDNTTLFDIQTLSGGGSGTGLINFTPNVTGEFFVMISVNDSGGLLDQQSVFFNITENRPPYFSDVPTLLNCPENSLCLYDVNATDPDDDNLSFFNNNTGLFTINITTGVISFLPEWYDVGIYNISLNVTDGEFYNYSYLMLNISPVNDTPYFDPEISSYVEWSNVTEGFEFVLILNATDEENDTLSFSSTFINESDLFTIQLYSQPLGQAIINFTPSVTDIGNHTVNITVSDSITSNTTQFEFEVQFYNDAPTINYWNVSNSTFYTTDLNVTLEERDTLTFEANATDPDISYNDSLMFYWYLDGTLVASNQTSYNYTPNYNSEGNKTLNVTVVDSGGLNDTHSWTVVVVNRNRLPYFGKKYYLDENAFDNGSYTNVTYNNGVELLSPLTEGAYTSGVIDMVDDNGNFKFTTLIIDTNLTDGMNLTYQTRSSQTSTITSNWSTAKEINDTVIPSTSQRYFQFRLLFEANESSNTPVVNNVTVNYIIDNQTWSEDTAVDPWFDLDDFFTEFDSNDDLAFNLSQTSHVTIDINTTTNKVSVTPEADWYGAETVTFYASDDEGTVSSNLVTITYTDVTDTENTRTVTRTRTITKTSLKKENVTIFDPIKLLYPGNVTLYENNTFKAPIYLKNMANTTFRDINLSVYSQNPNVSVSLTEYEFDVLEDNTQVMTELTVNSYKIYGTYEVEIFADVAEPHFSDSAKILINSIERAEDDRSLTNIKIAFARDLVTQNKECLELNELLNKAVEEMDRQNFEKAGKLVDQVRTACNYLREPHDESMARPGFVSSMGKILFFVIGLMIVGLSALAIYFIYMHFKRKYFDY